MRQADPAPNVCVMSDSFAAASLQGLKEETGHDPGYKKCGSITVARTEDRMVALRRAMAKAQSFGLEAEMVDAAACGAFWTHPETGVELMKHDDLKGGLWLPGDGSGSPTDLTMALIAGAKSRGTTVFEDVHVTGFDAEVTAGRRQVRGVQTEHGAFGR